MSTTPSPPKSPWLFFLLVLALSLPFWLIGPLLEQFLPKDRPIDLPVSALMAFTPMLAALILRYREGGGRGARELLARTFDFGRIANPLWYLPIFFLMPAVMVAAYAAMRLTGAALPEPQVALLTAPVFFVVFFIAAAGEELGWQGYAAAPLQARRGALAAALIIGTVWAAWHIPPLLQQDRAPEWIAAHFVGTVALRVLIVWLYNNAGNSIFAAIVFHAMINVATFLFPNHASHYDPFYTAIFLVPAAAAVTYLWGAKTLARYR